MNVPEKHKAVAHAWADGAEVECKTPITSTWQGDSFPDWIEQNEYRIKPTKPSIDWSHVSPAYTHMATDKDGRTWLYHNRPPCGERQWEDPYDLNFPPCKAETFTSFKAGICDWKDSLVARPRGVQHGAK